MAGAVIDRAEVDCVVIGAGVIGLACARRIAQSGREVLILEAEGEIGTGVSARNSEVIHAGIYYPTGSLKARLCVAGTRASSTPIAPSTASPHAQGRQAGGRDRDRRRSRRCTKLMAQARANGVDDLALLSADEARARWNRAVLRRAPSTRPRPASSTAHGLMLSLLGEAEARGAALARHAPVSAAGWRTMAA